MPLSDNPDQKSESSRPTRKFYQNKVVISLIIAVCIAAWVIVKTEMRVRELAAQGFTDVVFESVRNHAYAPLIGAYVGSLVSVLIFMAIKRLIRRKK